MPGPDSQASTQAPYPDDWTAADVAKDKRLQRVYGITLEVWWDLWDQQDGRCGVCKKELGDNANCDHDHVTREIRGLLCPRCNRYRVGRRRWPEIEEVYSYLRPPPAKMVGTFIVPVRNRVRRR